MVRTESAKIPEQSRTIGEKRGTTFSRSRTLAHNQINALYPAGVLQLSKISLKNVPPHRFALYDFLAPNTLDESCRGTSGTNDRVLSMNWHRPLTHYFLKLCATRSGQEEN